MKDIIRLLKKKLGYYETGYEYWVKLDDIVIIPQFKDCPPRKRKLQSKWAYYRQTGEFESPIKLMKNFTLVDGYTTYLIAQKADMGVVPVYFVD